MQHLPCPHCGSSDARSINDAGWGHCFSCNHKTPPEAMDEAPAAPTPGPRKNKPGLLTDLEYADLPARRITAETCRKFGYGLGEFKDDLVQVAPYYRDGRVVAQKVRDRHKRFTLLGDTKDLPLFGQNLWSGGKWVVVTEGEIDAMSFSQAMDNKWAVVSLPNGAQSAAKALSAQLEWLNRFEKVILAFDQDDAGRSAIEAAAQVLPPGKAYVVTLSRKDANEVLKQDGPDELRRAPWNASPWRPDAVLAGSDLRARVSAYKGPEGVQWPWDGFSGLCPVIPLRAVTTVVAGTGAGKSTFCRALEAHLIARGERLGIMHLEEDVARSAMGLVGYAMGKRLDLGVAGVSPEDFDKAWEVSAGRDGVFFYDHFGSVDPDNIVAKIRYFARAGGCRYVVLDHLSIVVSGLEVTDERKALDVAMTKLRSLVQETGIGLILVVHLRRGSGKPAENGGEITLADLRGSQGIAQLSDLVVALERDQQADGPAKNLTTARFLKNRPTGETGAACKLEWERDTGWLIERDLNFGGSKPDEFGDESANTPQPWTDEEIPF